MARICVAMSGGVDSLCSLVLLKNAGHDLIAVHARFSSSSCGLDDEALGILAHDCRKLGVEFEVVDLASPFNDKVIKPFAKAYIQGFTPNPCAHCNREIKFGLLLDHALAMSADFLATGHYACLTDNIYLKGAPPLIARHHSYKKDQSYFLALLTSEQRSHAIFPLHDYDKEQCRQEVTKMGLQIPIPRESQDICFIRNSSYKDFLHKYCPDQLPSEGPIYFTDDANSEKAMFCIGVHQGLWNYTEGQRQGLGISWNEPLYVLQRNMRKNALIVGPKKMLGMTGCLTRDVVFHIAYAEWPEEIFVKVRASRESSISTVKYINDRPGRDRLFVKFLHPQFPSAPGQIAAFYDKEGRILAGAIIEEIFYA